MPIIPLQGSLETQSSRERSISLRPELQDKFPVLDGQALTDEAVVKDTLINNTSINEDSFRDSMDMVAAYPEGRVVIVTYYSQNAPITDIMSKTSDMVMETKDDVHISWTEIREFELRCQSEFNFEYSEDSNVSKLSGEALVFPGFVPKISDIFIYGIRNGKIGVFRVSNIQRLAIGQDTYHRITFTLQELLGTQLRDRLRRQSVVCYFDKTKYIVGNNAMLTTEGFIQQKDLRHYRKEIIRNYVDRFYDPEFSSFMNKDKVFDPYVVEYWNKKVDYMDSPVRPVQLLISVGNYMKTIWSVLTNNPIKDLKNIEMGYDINVYANTFWGVNITSLLGDKFITLGNDDVSSGSRLNPTIDANGKPILVDTTPYFHSHDFDQAIYENAKRTFDIARHAFYGDHLPHRKCAPHQHPLKMPHPCKPEDCKVCGLGPHGEHFSFPSKKPPFPIHSDEELIHIWRRINKIKKKQILTEDEKAKARGYVLWYRENFPGTLSRVELEKEYRASKQIAEDLILTPTQIKELDEYIDSYRSKFLPVLEDRELEFIWRTRKRYDYNIQLPELALLELQLVIKQYRDLHGSPEVCKISSELGSPISSDLLQVLQSTPNYDDVVLLDPPAIGELVESIDSSSKKPIPSDYIPILYLPTHPLPHAELHCHDVCHRLCGQQVGHTQDTLATVDSTKYYALSKEFYLGSTAMDPFEKLMYDAITNKEIDPARVIEAIARYLEWDDEDAFYRHLFCLYLIDKALFWLRFHS